jgi:O-Antigen ligase
MTDNRCAWPGGMLVWLMVASGAVVGLIIGCAAEVIPVWYGILCVALMLLIGVSRLAGISISTTLLLTGMVGEMFLGDIDIGPCSVRIYIYSLLFVWAVQQAAFTRRPLFPLPSVKKLVLLYGLFVGWKVIASLAQGALLEVVLQSTMSHDVVALITCASIGVYIRTSRSYDVAVRVLLMALVVSCLVAVLQWLGTNGAWDLWFKLRPGLEDRYRLDVGSAAGEAGQHLVPGLYASAFSFSYYLAAIGPLLFGLLFRSRHRAVSLLGALAVLAGVIIVQERSAAVAFCVLFLAAGISVFRLSRTKLGTVLWLAGTAALIGGGAFFAWQSRDVAVGHYELNRFDQGVDVGRLALAQSALSYGAQHLLLGGGSADFVSSLQDVSDPTLRYRQATPHNLFLNAFVFYGLPGLILSSILVLATVRFGWAVWKQALWQSDWLTVGVTLGLLGYLVSAQFHNASFVTGDTLPWWLIGLLGSSANLRRGTVPHESSILPGPAAMPALTGARAKRRQSYA